MFHLFLSFFFFYSTLVYSGEFHAEMAPLLLEVGEQRILHVPNLKKYSLGSPIVRVHPLKKTLSPPSHILSESLLIKGMKAGWTDLWILKSDGKSEHRSIRIEKPNTKTRNQILEKALSTLHELEVYFTGTGAILKGEIQSTRELLFVTQILEKFPKDVKNSSQIHPDLKRECRQKLETFLKSSPETHALHLEEIHEQLWIKGQINDPKILPSLSQHLKSLYPPIQLDFSTPSMSAPTIHFRVFLFELKTNQFQSLGLHWPLILPRALHITQNGIQSIQDIDSTLHQLETNGQAKILSNPELVVRAPGEAELFAGGKIPISTQSRYQSQLHWERFGLTLRLKVSESSSERVRLDILTEISHLDLSLGSEKAPGVQMNRMTTQVDAQFGVPLFLSGLLQEQTREQAKGIPFLKNMPVLGKLFGSEDYLNQRSELVAILYPYVKPPTPPLKKINSQLPLERLRIPNQWLSLEEEKTLKASQEYPWNVLN